MNVGELKEMLEDLDDDLEIRLAHQPSWPLRFNLRSVVTPEGHMEALRQEAWDAGRDPDEVEADEDNSKFVWLVEGDHPYDESPYAPRILWEA